MYGSEVALVLDLTDGGFYNLRVNKNKGVEMLGPIGWPELTIIVILALLIVGPKGLPKLGKSVGKAIRDFKREANELKQAVEFEIDEDDRKEVVKKKKKKKKKKPSGQNQESTSTSEPKETKDSEVKESSKPEPEESTK